VKAAQFWRSITGKIFGALVGVSFVCIAVSVLSLSYQSGRALRAGIAERNLEIAKQASHEISRYISESIDELGALGSILGPLPYDTWIRRTVLSNLSLEFQKYRWMAIIGADGQVITDSRLNDSESSLLDADSTNAIRADKTIASPVRIADDFTPYMIISAPARFIGGTKGWLVAELYLRNIWSLVDEISVGGNGVAYLVSSDGKLIAHPDKIRILSPEKSEPVTIPPADLSEKGVVRVEKQNGVQRYLTAYARVNGVEWVVAVQQPVQDAFLPASVLFRQSLILVLLGIALSLVLGLFVSRAISSPLLTLLEGTRKISGGSLDYRIPDSDDDEIGRLAASFNTMVASLQTRSAQLVESERQYRLMAERVNDIIFTLDEHGIVGYISSRLEHMTGYEPVHFLGSSFVERLPEHERERAGNALRDLLRGTERVDREIQFDFFARDGRKVLMEAHLTAESDPRGKRQVYGVVRDVSERARLIQQLNQAQKMEAVGRLAGGVAHDFNNLLTAIIGYCDYSILSLDDADTLRKNLEEIKKAGNRAAALTQQLLAFSRRQVLKPKVLDLNQLVANLEKLLKRLLGEDIALETHFAPDLGNVLADPGQIEQVIMNLCINARDAMPRGGRIIVETSNASLEAPVKDAGFSLVRGDYIHLRIVDTGIGMSPEIKSHLFEPFFTTKEVGKGTGLGLSTVYGIVKQTGGYIWAESELGKGSAFDIYFPRVEDGMVAAESPAVAQEVRGGTEAILIVEDEAMIRALVKNVLGSHGYTVFEADNGENAQKVFRGQGAIRLILTDVVLPGMSGRDLVERLAELRPEIPAIFMSGYTRDVIDSHGILHAGLAFLQKPFTPDTLLLKVREVLDSHNPA
jgi:PAS domain S-box-containing protein